VLASLRKLYDRLHLKVNEAKSAVARATGRKFLGYALWRAAGGEVKRAVASKAIDTFKIRIRQLTRRTCGRSIAEVADALRGYVPGWKAYFRLAQTPRVFRELDEWLRHRCVPCSSSISAGERRSIGRCGRWALVRTRRHGWRAMPAAGGITAVWN
jgi:RNA-directed DNA polymerase